MLQPDFLLLAGPDGPALELKTFPAGKKFSLDKSLRRAGKHFRILESPAPDPWPVHWQNALASLKERGLSARLFTWTDPVSGSQKPGGPGAMVHCRQCSRAILLRFTPQNHQENDAQCAAALAGLTDHDPQNPDRPARISVFDIESRPLPGLNLAKGLFNPGAFHIELRDKTTRMILDRLGPADVLLRDAGLQEFARRVLPAKRLDSPFVPEDITSSAGEALEWDCSLARSPLQKLAARTPGTALRKERWLRLRIWTLPAANRILALQIRSGQRLDHDLFTQLCRDYVIIPQEKSTA